MEELIEIDDEWENFKNNDFDLELPDIKTDSKNLIIPKASDIYISTKK